MFNQAVKSLVHALLVLSVSAGAQDLPTSLMCISNARAERALRHDENEWFGVVPPDPAKPFGIVTTDDRSEMDNESEFVVGTFYVLKNQVFSGLNTDKPIVRLINRFKDGDDKASEFRARVVSRYADTVFLVWGNDPQPNKVWSAAVDLAHRKVVLTQVVHGALGTLSGKVATLDCR